MKCRFLGPGAVPRGTSANTAGCVFQAYLLTQFVTVCVDLHHVIHQSILSSLNNLNGFSIILI